MCIQNTFEPGSIATSMERSCESKKDEWRILAFTRPPFRSRSSPRTRATTQPSVVTLPVELFEALRDFACEEDTYLCGGDFHMAAYRPADGRMSSIEEAFSEMHLLLPPVPRRSGALVALPRTSPPRHRRPLEREKARVLQAQSRAGGSRPEGPNGALSRSPIHLLEAHSPNAQKVRNGHCQAQRASARPTAHEAQTRSKSSTTQNLLTGKSLHNGKVVPGDRAAFTLFSTAASQQQ